MAVDVAVANCVTSGSTVTCESTSPNPYTTQTGTGSAETTLMTVYVQNGATINAGANQNAVSLGDDAVINMQTGATVTNCPTNNSANVGRCKAGHDTIEFRNNGSLTVQAGAQITCRLTVSSLHP